MSKTKTKMIKTYLETKDVIDISLLGWYSEIESQEAGCVVWTNKKNDIRIYATPSWEVDGETPFNVVSDEENNDAGDDVAFLRFTQCTPINVQKEMYLSVIKSIIKSL